MNLYQDIIQKQGVHYLVHFTKSSNLPFILGDEQLQSSPNGIVADDLLPQEFERNAKKRSDGHTSYVCCSVEFPNLRLQYWQQKQQEDNLFDEWAFVYIDPSIIDDTTLFSPTSASAGNGINLDNGPDALANLFAEKTEYLKMSKKQLIQSEEIIRPADLPSCYASNMRAEVMIKDKIPKEYIKEIRFPSTTFDYEQSRLRLCHVDLTNIKLSSFKNREMWKIADYWPKK